MLMYRRHSGGEQVYVVTTYLHKNDEIRVITFQMGAWTRVLSVDPNSSRPRDRGLIHDVPYKKFREVIRPSV